MNSYLTTTMAMAQARKQRVVRSFRHLVLISIANMTPPT